MSQESEESRQLSKSLQERETEKVNSERSRSKSTSRSLNRDRSSSKPKKPRDPYHKSRRDEQIEFIDPITKERRGLIAHNKHEYFNLTRDDREALFKIGSQDVDVLTPSVSNIPDLAMSHPEAPRRDWYENDTDFTQDIRDWYATNKGVLGGYISKLKAAIKKGPSEVEKIEIPTLGYQVAENLRQVNKAKAMGIFEKRLEDQRKEWQRKRGKSKNKKKESKQYDAKITDELNTKNSSIDPSEESQNPSTSTNTLSQDVKKVTFSNPQTSETNQPNQSSVLASEIERNLIDKLNPTLDLNNQIPVITDEQRRDFLKKLVGFPLESAFEDKTETPSPDQINRMINQEFSSDKAQITGDLMMTLLSKSASKESVNEISNILLEVPSHNTAKAALFGSASNQTPPLSPRKTNLRSVDSDEAFKRVINLGNSMLEDNVLSRELALCAKTIQEMRIDEALLINSDQSSKLEGSMACDVRMEILLKYRRIFRLESSYNDSESLNNFDPISHCSIIAAEISNVDPKGSEIITLSSTSLSMMPIEGARACVRHVLFPFNFINIRLLPKVISIYGAIANKLSSIAVTDLLNIVSTTLTKMDMTTTTIQGLAGFSFGSLMVAEIALDTMAKMAKSMDSRLNRIEHKPPNQVLIPDHIKKGPIKVMKKPTQIHVKQTLETCKYFKIAALAFPLSEDLSEIDQDLYLQIIMRTDEKIRPIYNRFLGLTIPELGNFTKLETKDDQAKLLKDLIRYKKANNDNGAFRPEEIRAIMDSRSENYSGSPTYSSYEDIKVNLKDSNDK